MASRARDLGRRSRVRKGIPNRVQIPKFVVPAELDEVRRRKKENPDQPWEAILQDILRESKEALMAKK